MNWKKMLFIIFLLSPLLLMADIPGNKPRPDCNVQINGLNKFNNYDFFYSFRDNMEARKITDSSNLILVGGYGAPSSLKIFGRNKTNGNQTQTIYLYNNLDKTNLVLSLDTIIGDSLIQYQELESEVKIKDNKNINKSVVDDNKKSNNWILIGLGFLALDILILVYFLKRRKKRKIEKDNL